MSNVYEIVTEKIIEQLEAGVAPWRKPWTSEPPCNLVSQKAYRGLNTFLLGVLLRYYSVFKLSQTEAIAEKLGLGDSKPRVGSIEDCEAIVSGMPNPPAREQNAAACYIPSKDVVGMPAR